MFTPQGVPWYRDGRKIGIIVFALLAIGGVLLVLFLVILDNDSSSSSNGSGDGSGDSPRGDNGTGDGDGDGSGSGDSGGGGDGQNTDGSTINTGSGASVALVIAREMQITFDNEGNSTVSEVPENERTVKTFQDIVSLPADGTTNGPDKYIEVKLKIENKFLTADYSNGTVELNDGPGSNFFLEAASLSEFSGGGTSIYAFLFALSINLSNDFSDRKFLAASTDNSTDTGQFLSLRSTTVPSPRTLYIHLFDLEESIASAQSDNRVMRIFDSPNDKYVQSDLTLS